MNPLPFNFWDTILGGVTNDDIQAYLDDYGITPEPPKDAKLIADVTSAKTAATSTGNTKLVNTLDFILKYGDKALSILTKNGILKNQNLAASTYSIDFDALSKDLATNSAPDASSRVFNIDFTDPKVLIITFLLIMILSYFLFFNSKKNGSKR